MSDDREPPRISERQRRMNAEDAYWCGRQFPCDNCRTVFFEVDLADGLCCDCKPPIGPKP